MKKIATDVDFAESSYKSCESDKDTLIIYIESWNNKTIKVIFFNAIQFIYRGSHIIEDVYEIDDETFLKEALIANYGEVPKEHSFKVFGIFDIDDVFLFEVVAEKISVSEGE